MLLVYLNLADMPIKMCIYNVHICTVFSHIGPDLCAPHTFILSCLCGGDCDCDPCGNYKSFLKKYVIC